MIRHRHILLCLLLITGMYVWDGFAQTRTEMPRKHNYYMYLKEKLDGSYQVAYDKQVWLHYEEPYSVTDTQCLRFRVFDDNHSLVVETDEYGIPANPNCPRVPIQYGDNWVTVNLSSLTSFDQFYTMEVWDSKGETRYLRFLCKPSQLSVTEMEQGWLEKPAFPADTTFSDPRVKKQTVIGTSGSRRYELTDHLGNVMAVISDRKIGVDTDSDGYVNYYAPEIIAVYDYYPYGYPIRERCFSREDYRYGFNGQESDAEVYGTGSLAGYEFRQYDTRLGRWWGMDPMRNIYPATSPYLFCIGNPIMIKDPNGKYGVVVINEENDKNGNVTGGTATLVMTYYYNSSSRYKGEDGRISKENAKMVEDNIKSNLEKLVCQTININGKEYEFAYDIQFVDLANEYGSGNPERWAQNETYQKTGFIIGNYMENRTLCDGTVGRGAQKCIQIDFEKLLSFIATGRSDGQTPIHELLHNLGAIDTKMSGTGIMDENQQVDDNPVEKRELQMKDIEQLIEDPNNDRLNVVYE